MTWLGTNLDFDNKIFSIPDKRTFSISTTIIKIVQSLPYTTARTLAKLCGKICLGKCCQLKTRRLCKVINFRTSWDSKINMSQFPEGISGIFFWKKNFKILSLRKPPSHTNFQTIGVSEARSTGYATNLTINNVQYTAYKSFRGGQPKTLCLKRNFSHRICVKSFVNFLKNSSVMWKTDNYTSTFIVNSGNSKDDLQKKK